MGRLYSNASARRPCGPPQDPEAQREAGRPTEVSASRQKQHMLRRLLPLQLIQARIRRLLRSRRSPPSRSPWRQPQEEEGLMRQRRRVLKS